MKLGKQAGLGLAALALLALAAPVEAAKATKSAKGEWTLDPEKGDVRASLTALTTALGATIVGDSAKLTQPAPTAPLTGSPDKILKKLLKDQDYVVKTDSTGKITQVVIMSGNKGKAPPPSMTKPPASSVASNTGAGAPPAGMSSTTASMIASAKMAEASPSYGGQKQPAGAPQPIPPMQAQVQATNTFSSPTPATPGATNPQPVNITPEMQAQIAAATAQARTQLDTLVGQLKAACPAGQKC